MVCVPLLSVNHSDTNSSVDLLSEGTHFSVRSLELLRCCGHCVLCLAAHLTACMYAILGHAMVYYVLSWRVVLRVVRWLCQGN